MSDRIGKVMDATRDLIFEVGINGISMGKIAKKANVPVGNLYYWFENKSDLINKTYVRSRNKLIPEMIENDQKDIVASIKTYLKACVRKAIENSEDHMLVENLYLLPIIKPENIMSTGEHFGDEKLYELMEANILKKTDAKLLGVVAMGIINKVIISKRLSNTNMSDEEIDLLVNICWDAIKV